MRMKFFGGTGRKKRVNELFVHPLEHAETKVQRTENGIVR